MSSPCLWLQYTALEFPQKMKRRDGGRVYPEMLYQ